MANDLLQLIKTRKHFHQDYYRRACSALVGALIIILLLSVLVVYLFIKWPSPDFYASSNDGKLIPLTPMSTPNYSHEPLIQ